ncbi:unnamed protein product [Rhizophagus irregularis]|nr:unnamed protein product [Rhizophagus irregularis]
MPYDKTRNNQSVQKAPYHDSRFTNRIIPQRGYTNLTETPNDNHSLINLIPSPEIVMNINNEEDHEENLQEESYQFLVKRASIGVQKNNRISTSTTPEVINELLFDNDNVSEDERRELEDSSVVDEDITSESDEDCQVDFSVPEIEINRGESIHYEKESDDQYSWIVIWILNKPAVAPKFTECTYQDFPDHPMSNKRNPCGATLYKNVYTKDGIIKKLALIFPTISLKHQLSILFKRKGFEES